MALDSREIIKNLCPDLFASDLLEGYLGMAIELTDKSFYGKVYPYAVAYRACHLFTITGGGEAGGGSAAIGMGEIASMSEGGLSVTFARNKSDSSSGSNALDTTKFGKLLLDLTRSRPTMGVNTAGLHTRI